MPTLTLSSYWWCSTDGVYIATIFELAKKLKIIFHYIIRLTQPYRCRYNGLQMGEGDVALPELLR